MDFSNLRPGVPICPPAIARHVVFRLGLEENPRWQADSEAGWERLETCLGKHVDSLRRAQSLPDGIHFIPPDKPPEVAPPYYSLRGTCLIPINDEQRDGYRMRVRIDVHTELFSLTCLIDRVRAGKLAERFGQLLDPCTAAGSARHLLNEVWTEGDPPAAKVFEDWIRRASNGAAQRDFGHLITDFRGIVISPGDGWAMDETSLEADKTGCRRRPRMDPELTRFAEDHAGLIRAVAAPALPGLDVSSEEQRQALTMTRGEAVVCGMLDGKALYAAALGGHGVHDSRPHPVRHLLVYAGHCEVQLGRLLRRMHVLGELRHAAMLDYDADPVDPLPAGARTLRDVSREIRQLGRDISTAQDKGGGAQQPIDVPSIATLQHHVGRLSALSQFIEGGLTYRVEQSRYYADEFQRLIEHLRLVRIGDWQPYDDFVQRYVLHLFARIDRIGNRYEALGRRVDRLLFAKQAQLLDSYTKGVRETLEKIDEATRGLKDSGDLQVVTLGEIGAATRGLSSVTEAQSGILENIKTATEELKSSAGEQIEASKEQIKLLGVAEMFAVVFLFYYVGTVLLKLFDIDHIPTVWNEEAYVIAWSVLIGIAGALLSVFIIRSWVRRGMAWWRRKRAAKVLPVDQSKTPKAPS